MVFPELCSSTDAGPSDFSRLQMNKGRGLFTEAAHFRNISTATLSLSRIYIYMYILIYAHTYINNYNIYIYIYIEGGREGERERESYTYVICTVCLYHWLSLHISIYWVDLGFSYFKPCTPGPPPPQPARVRVLHAASQHQRHGHGGHGHGRPGRGRCDRFYGSFWGDFINKVMIW